MNTPQPPNLEKLRERRKVPLEGIAWLSFVLLTLAFGIFMTFKSYGASTNLVERADPGKTATEVRVLQVER